MNDQEMGDTSDVKSTTISVLGAPCVQATDHQTKNLDERKQTRSVDGHELQVTIHGRIDKGIVQFDRRPCS